MFLVIYGGHKSISPWVFSTWSQGDGAAERCWSTGNALTRTNFHFASQEVALRGVSCWDLRLAVSSSTASAGPGDIPSSHPTDCSGSENSRFLALLGIFFFFLGCSHRWQLAGSLGTVRNKGATQVAAAPLAYWHANIITNLLGADKRLFLAHYIWPWQQSVEI